ncbi:Chloroperoxidase [Podospora didyma]|uniref:Chloroperoxidase n=1 Tax=Podospora didyma TaxID=330526 RepID=A0AAE0K8P1_9PEZI|nr:Chloroperoxidase [Podospora didyma]
MKPVILSAFAAVTPVLAGFDSWAPPGPYDVRAPCPMLNTLANHGFLPHDGKHISKKETENALFDALNINKTLGSFLFDFALRTSPKKNATHFSLNDLGNHNILEHDASLSRPDAYFGNVLAFNQSVFDETKKHFTADIVDLQMAANARMARILDSRAINPNYTMSDLGDSFTYGESAAYVAFMGDKNTGTANKSRIEWLFEHEQLPQHLGWHRSAETFQQGDLTRLMDVIRNLTKASFPQEFAARMRKRTISHWGFN